LTVQVDSRQTGENARRILRRDPEPHLFRPLTIRSVTIKNRIMLSPMCQYSGTDGFANDWHLVHLGARAAGGAGVVATEAVHTEPRARITKHCLGLWNDAQRDVLARIAAFIASQNAVPAIQLGHAGRKASVGRPWEGTRPLTDAEGAWKPMAPSSLAYAEGWQVPEEMDHELIEKSIDDFRTATRRAHAAGFRILEVHCAHGYLFHQFLSPLSNARSDDYGGKRENRARLLFQTLDAVREEWPAELPLFVRLSVTDWVDGGWSVADSVWLCQQLAKRGDVDLIDCSSGGNDPRQRIPIHPGYQIPFADEIKKTSGLKTGALGLINSPDLAESVIANGQADLVVLGRTLLGDPVWPLRSANALKAADVDWPIQYERSNIF